MNAYDWLRHQISLVPRQKFFLFKPVSAQALQEFEAQFGQLPPDYRAFVDEFGEARLFRESFSPNYWIRVFAPPGVAREEKGTTWLRLGWLQDGSHAFYRWEAGGYQNDGGVFFGERSKRTGAPSFADWLKRSFAIARKQYSSEEWAEVLQPVPPFTAAEQAIVDAMSLFKTRKIGLSAGGKGLYEVTNNSSIKLPRLTFEVRWPRGIGRGSLPTKDIGPGETKIVEASFYAEIVEQQHIELVPEPPPHPEDRPFYAEFEGLSAEPPKKGTPAVATQTASRSSPDPSYGSWKFIHEIGPHDLLEHPVWLWCTQLGLPDEADGPIGGDETSLRPQLDSDEVPLDHSAPPLILLRVKGRAYHAAGLFNREKRRIEVVRIFLGEETVPPGEVRDLPEPAVYQAIPLIGGKREVEFRSCAPGAEEAVEVRTDREDRG